MLGSLVLVEIILNKLLFLGEKLSYNRDRASLITFPVRNWERDKRDKQDNEIFPSYCHQSPVTSHQSPFTNPRLICSLSIAVNKARKLPSPKPAA
ncbi:hypothetical protein NIES73_21490 [Sphaerospermopsis kisseleviana NIES-73]|nr:hypothetical protein NIES73_21490 [Sphaerospermopsis kisseleviana NIES-73]